MPSADIQPSRPIASAPITWLPTVALVAAFAQPPATAQATAQATVDPRNRSVLFVRGADGTGGLGRGTTQRRTEHLSDISNTSQQLGNHGFGELAALLRNDGFKVSQWIESPGQLTSQRLHSHRIVVFGSNNRRYQAAEIAAFHAFMDAGGAALFISDANWGPNFDAAPQSDNQFLSRYGLVMHQDSANGIPVMQRSGTGRFLQPDHPALSGPDARGGSDDIDSYEGEGVSYQRVGPGTSGWVASVLVSAVGFRVRPVTGTGRTGSLRNADQRDGALVMSRKGDGLILTHYDRNSWFNRNGTGSNLYRRDNRQLALNIFRTLASVPARAQTVGSGCGRAGRRPRLLVGNPELGRGALFSLRGTAQRAPTWLLFAIGPANPVTLPGGCVVQPQLGGAVFGFFGSTDTFGGLVRRLPLPGDHRLSGIVLTAQMLILVPGGPVFGDAELSNGAELRLGFAR